MQLNLATLNSIKMKENFLIFIIFFTIYIYLGFCISFFHFFDIFDIYFGADTNRVAHDLTSIEYNHYRIKVHPLFLILTQPVALFINGFTNNKMLSIIILESSIGAMSVTAFGVLLNKFLKDKYLRYEFIALYGLSFSSLMFSTIPETFIFYALTSLLFLIFIANSKSKGYSLSRNEIYICIAFGVLNWGITITNFIFYEIFLLFLIFSRQINDKFKIFIHISLYAFLLTIIFCLIQKLIWNQSPVFIESILRGLYGFGYEESRYMNFNISIKKTILWIKQIFCYPLLSPDVYLWHRPDGRPCLLFGAYKIISYLFVVSFYVMFFVYFILYIYRQKKFVTSDNIFFITIAVVLLGNYLLHYFYGHSEAFIYSQHYLHLMLLLLAAFVNYSTDIERCLLKFYLFVFILFETFNNIKFHLHSAKLALSTVNKEYVPEVALIGTIHITLLFICAYYIVNFFNLKLSQYMPNKIVHNFILKGTAILLVCIVVIECIFIKLNVGGFSTGIKSIVDNFCFIVNGQN